MFGKEGFSFIDFLEFLIQRKEIITLVFLVSLVLSYLGIFFLIPPQYDATATLIPQEEEISSIASSLLGGNKKVPFGLNLKSSSGDIDLYKTIIYSRTMLEDVIQRYDLVKAYKLDTTDVEYMELAIKELKSRITTKETEESAFIIKVRAHTPQVAADMTNYIIKRMNDRIVDLKIQRSKQNRLFLEKRVEEITQQLKLAEDSLRKFQEHSGLLDAKTQLQGILTTHATLETELIAKRFQLGVLERLYEKDSKQVQEAKIQIQEFERKLEDLRKKGDPESPLLPLKKLPKTTVEFVRLYREVELYSLILEYILPLYEQSKIEEKRDYPIIQVIDYAIPPAKKSWPPRILFSLIIATLITIIIIGYLFIRLSILTNAEKAAKMQNIIRQLKSWKI